MTTPKTLQTLVRLKSNKKEQAEALLQSRRTEALQVEQALQAQQAQQELAELSVRAHRQALSETLSRCQGFLGTEIITRQLLLRDSDVALVTAEAETQQAQQALKSARTELQEATCQLRRVEEQIKTLEERLKQALRAQELLRDEAQDEESEEAAVARIIATSRARQRSRWRIKLQKTAQRVRAA